MFLPVITGRQIRQSLRAKEPEASSLQFLGSYYLCTELIPGYGIFSSHFGEECFSLDVGNFSFVLRHCSWVVFRLGALLSFYKAQAWGWRIRFKCSELSHVLTPVLFLCNILFVYPFVPLGLRSLHSAYSVVCDSGCDVGYGTDWRFQFYLAPLLGSIPCRI